MFFNSVSVSRDNDYFCNCFKRNAVHSVSYCVSFISHLFDFKATLYCVISREFEVFLRISLNAQCFCVSYISDTVCGWLNWGWFLVANRDMRMVCGGTEGEKQISSVRYAFTAKLIYIFSLTAWEYLQFKRANMCCTQILIQIDLFEFLIAIGALNILGS